MPPEECRLLSTSGGQSVGVFEKKFVFSTVKFYGKILVGQGGLGTQAEDALCSHLKVCRLQSLNIHLIADYRSSAGLETICFPSHSSTPSAIHDCFIDSC